MFSTENLQNIDLQYFIIIYADIYDVTMISKNTGHVWYIHNPEYPMSESCIIFHKHKISHPYHFHGKAETLQQAIKSIKAHDVYQLNGRRIVNSR